jgi:hypothetical protein
LNILFKIGLCGNLNGKSHNSTILNVKVYKIERKEKEKKKIIFFI